MRRRLLDATRAVFSRVGYHGLSVELVIEEAGLSRPTFYKHFRNTDEAIEEVVREVNDRLVEALLVSVAGESDAFAMVEAGLLAWRAWGEELGPMLGPLYAEFHDARSPASRHRRRVLDQLASLLVRVVEGLGRPRPSRLAIETLIQGVEYLGYRFHLETPRDAGSWKATRDAMMRLALAMLGTEAEWARAVPLARSLHIDLAHPV